MGSRLKGRKRTRDRPSWRVHKLALYTLLALATIILLWYLYLWREHP